MKRTHAALKRLHDAHTLAAANGGTCLTTATIGERKSFEFTCPKGHKNFFKRHDTVKLGKYCPSCAMKQKGKNQMKYSKADLDLYAAGKGGQCLSESYLGYNEDHRWECDKGHQWEARPRMVLGMDSWCPECAGNKKYTVKELSSLVANRGGKCLDLTYDPATERSSAVWECHFGHRWTARVDMIIRRGDWCPTCSGSYGERLCRQIIEKLFEAPFPKVRPSWLRGDKGLPLEIDMFNPGLFGVEYQGIHHYRPTGYTHDTFERISSRDAFKVKQCSEVGVHLVAVPHFRNIQDDKMCIAVVRNELQKSGIIVPDREISIDYRKVYLDPKRKQFFVRS